MIKFSCPHCEKTFEVEPQLGGRRFKCAACGGAITVPEASASLNEGSLLDDLAALGSGPAQGAAVPGRSIVAPVAGPPGYGAGSDRAAAFWSMVPMPLGFGREPHTPSCVAVWKKAGN